MATQSAAALGNSAFRHATSNASAARAVFDVEKSGGVRTSLPPPPPSRGRAQASSAAATRTGKSTTVRSATGGTHSFAESETIAFSEFINETLADDKSVAHLLPVDVEAEEPPLFDVLKDGVVLCKLINCAAPDTIDMRCVHTGAVKPLSVFEVVENLNMAINAAVAIGCRVVNIGPDDVMSGSPHLVLGLLWQIVKAAIMAKINLKANPELVALLGEEGEDDIEAIKALNALAPEKVLMKWLNYQVQRVAPEAKDVNNFGVALKDCTVYANLLMAVAPDEQQGAAGSLLESVLAEEDALARAQLVIDAASQLGVTQFKVQAEDIAKGNEKLNMGYVAAIFNHLPGLDHAMDEGVFNGALACESAEVTDGGKGVKMADTGSALFGPPLEANTGLHFVELRVLEATDAACYIGMMRNGGPASMLNVPGLATPSIGLMGGGGVWRDGLQRPGAEAGQAGIDYGKGDLIRVEFDSDSADASGCGTLKWYKNGVVVDYNATAVPAGLQFAVGRGEGTFEVKIENSSFMGGGGGGASSAGGGGGVSAAQQALLAQLEEDEDDSREERAFRMWINSLGLETHVSDLTAEVRDGLLLLQLMDTIKPGSVDWKKAALKPRNVHEKVFNCNYAVQLGKSAFGFSLVGISGKDLQDGIVKLILALTWQLMRYHIIQFLSSMSSKALTEKDVLEWANAKVAASSADMQPLSKLTDSSVSSGLYILALVKSVVPRAVDMKMATPGKTPDEKKLNARLAVSSARRAGCMVFLLWEDIAEVKPKMLLVLLATLMQLDIAQNKAAE